MNEVLIEISQMLLMFLLLGGILSSGVFAGITTMISTNGMMVSDSYISSLNSSLAGSIVSDGISRYSRSLSWEKDPISVYDLESDGMIAFDEFSDSQKTTEDDIIRCLFIKPEDITIRNKAEIASYGLMTGRISSKRTIESAGMDIEGKGMINRVFYKKGNKTVYDRLFLAGIINGSDFVSVD